MSCKRVDDDRIPPVGVNIVFTTEGVWNTYGVSAAHEYRRFIRTATMKVPADFPYTVSSATGYGGVLLVGDVFGNPVAYDLACPVEVKPDIRVEVDIDAADAYCKICGSTYDIFMGNGNPTSGPAADKGYGLTRYKVYQGNGNTLNNHFITR